MKNFALVLAPLALAGCATMPSAPKVAPVEVAIIGINDIHGNLEPPKRSIAAAGARGDAVQVPAGGLAYLASAIDAVRARHANSVVVSAGDLISASPLPSALFLDEPTIHAMNAIGLEFNALGNHEFDRGRQEILRMQFGGCEKYTLREPCALEPYGGAQFQELAGNTITENGIPLLPATGIKTFGIGDREVSIGFIGLTTRTTGSLVSPTGIEGLVFADEAETINAAYPVLKAAGADAVVVLIHEGGATDVGYDDKSCSGLSGAILRIIQKLRVPVDAIVSGHTHQAYVCDMGTVDPGHPLLLTSAGYGGTLLTEIVLSIDPVAHKVVAARADNRIVQGEGYESSRGTVPVSDLYPVYAKRADVAAIVERYVDATKSISARPVGRLNAPAEKAQDRAGPRLIADAQLAATRSAGAQVAFMNPFGVRADLVPAPDGSVSFGQIFAVQPFGNTLVTMTLTGAQVRQALEQGLGNESSRQWLAPSAGFAYTYDLARPSGSRVTAITLDGKPLDPSASYRITVNSFLASGGDGYTVFKDGRDRTMGGNDLDALESWLGAVGTRAVPNDPRATGK